MPYANVAATIIRRAMSPAPPSKPSGQLARYEVARQSHQDSRKLGAARISSLLDQPRHRQHQPESRGNLQLPTEEETERDRHLVSGIVRTVPQF